MDGGTRVAADDECKVIGYFFLIPLGVFEAVSPGRLFFIPRTPSQHPQNLLLQQLLSGADEIFGDLRDDGIPQALRERIAQGGQ